jgi:hypothetical protein
MAAFDAVARRVMSTGPALKLAQRVARSIDPLTLSSVVTEDADLTKLDAKLSALLNVEKGPRGFAASAGLWFNPPISVWYEPGRVTVKEINERIVELPFVYAAAGTLPVGAKVLDFGASESVLAYSLAALGYEVIALDSRGYPPELRHPGLTVVEMMAEDWAGPDDPLDLITAVSAVEHVGIGYYQGQEPRDLGGDKELLGRFRHWLKPEGSLVLTVPFGEWHIDRFMRTYDQPHLESLLTGWEVTSMRTFWRRDPAMWTPNPSKALTATGVAIVRASPRQD